MSWWLFLPLSYLAIGFDRVCAGELSWNGAAPVFVLLMWSVLAVRANHAQSMYQACLLGLLADLSGSGALGVTPAVFVITIFLLGQVHRDESTRPLSWLWWSFPLMLVVLGGSSVCEWVLQASAVSPRLLARHIVMTVTVTFSWGVGLKLVWWAMRQLVRFPRASVPRELEASSFFLSR